MSHFEIKIRRYPGGDNRIIAQAVYRWITRNGYQERVVVERIIDVNGQASDANSILYIALLQSLMALEDELDARA